MNIAPNLAEIGLKYTDSMPTPFFFFTATLPAVIWRAFWQNWLDSWKKEREKKSGQLLVFYPSKSGPWITHDMIEKK